MVDAIEITQDEMNDLHAQGISRYRYPWDKWFNGEWHMIPWSELTQSPRAFRGLAYKSGTRRGFKVECKSGPSCWLLRGRFREDC